MKQDIFSLVRKDRLAQMTVNLGKYSQPIREFEKLVPKDALVAVCLPKSGFEYPLFGENLTRKLVPINSFLTGVQPIPAEASFLLFSSQVEDPLPTDRFLGSTWYLRDLQR